MNSSLLFVVVETIDYWIQVNILFGSIHLTLNQGVCCKTVKSRKSHKRIIELSYPSKGEKQKKVKTCDV